MSFARPGLLLLVLLLPCLAAAGVYGYMRRRRAVARGLGDPALVRRLGLTDPGSFELRRMALVAVAMAAFAVAAAGPQWGTRTVESRTRAMEVVLAVDLSNSMLAEDVSPNRLEHARLLVRRLMRELPGDRIGLVAFAGRAYVLAPLTSDHGALRLYVDALDPDVLSRGGSSLSSAVRQATDLLEGTQRAGADRAIVLISDGEALEDGEAVSQAAERAANAGVVVHTVAVGTDEGAPVPDRDPQTGRRSGYKRHASGEVVVSRTNAETLAGIAGRTGGDFVRLGSPDGTNRLVDALREMDRARTASTGGVEPHERYAWFVAAALALLALDALAAARRRPLGKET